MTETDGELIIRSRTELDLLLVNVEAAVRVRKRADFFSWVQGVLQGLIPHEVLICSLAEPGSRVHRMEWMSSAPADDARLAQLCGTGNGLLHRLIRLWEQSGRVGLALDARTAAAGVESALLAEQGKSNSEIAQILGISHLTVKNHVQKILRKLDVQNRAQAVARGISLNLTGAFVQ